MELAELKNKVHQLIENSSEEILTQISQILERHTSNNSTTLTITKELLTISEKEYQDGKTEPYNLILNESKSKYFNK